VPALRAVLAAVIVLAFAEGAEAQAHTAAFPTWEFSLPLANTGIPIPVMAASDSIRVQAGYQHWRGAGLGAIIGGAIGGLTGALGEAMSRCDDCLTERSVGESALITGLLGAGLGSVAGFLAGLSSPKYVWVPRDAVP
jgi:hypothetical protein